MTLLTVLLSVQREAPTVFYRLPSLMAADKSFPLLQPSLVRNILLVNIIDSVQIISNESDKVSLNLTYMDCNFQIVEINTFSNYRPTSMVIFHHRQKI